MDAFKTIGKATHNEMNRYRQDNNDEKWQQADMRGILDYCWGKDWEWLYDSNSNLNAMNEECQERYPMITLMDDSHYNWRGTEESMTATMQYITLVEATYNAKKKIKNSRQKTENIFEVAETVNA